jgi:hypothetical protein
VLQSIPVLGESRRVPHRVVRRKPGEPAIQKIIVELFHQLAFRADAVEHLEQQGAQQLLRWDREAARARIELSEAGAQVFLADRGIIANVRGYMVYGDYEQAAPLKDIIEGLTNGNIDVAIVWGPQAAWFASQQQTPLRVTPVADSRGNLPMSFNIAMGVRKQDAQLASELEAAMNRRRAEIDAILTAYHVPRFPIPTEKAEATP